MRLRILPLTIATFAVAVPALAATPDKGTVSKASPSITWEGTATGYGVVPANILVTTAGEKPVCEAPACDTFTLTVADKDDLTVTAAQRAHDNFTELHVVRPDGTVDYVQSADSEPAKIKVKGAVPGDYTIEILTNESAEQTGEYDADAKLGTAAPKPAATPAPGATPAPAPTPQAQPRPAASLALTTKSASARKLKKALKLVVSASSPVTDAQLALKKGKKVVGTAKLARIDGKGTFTLRLKKKLAKGSYLISVAARDEGRLVGVTAKFTVKK
jgi:hypothetical protein